MTWRRFVAGILLCGSVLAFPSSTVIAQGDPNISPQDSYQNIKAILKDLPVSLNLSDDIVVQKVLQDASANKDYIPTHECTFLARTSTFDSKVINEIIESQDFNTCLNQESAQVNYASTKVLVRDGVPTTEHIVVIRLH